MKLHTTLTKMTTYLDGDAHYILPADHNFIKINPLIGKSIDLQFIGEKYCASCGDKHANLYRMGFCKNCFFTSPLAGESIINPELSTAHLDKADRDLDYEKSYQLQPHVVYLANSGGLKVGVTRASQKTTRWTDQGASEAIVLAQTENRYQAGMIEVALKQHLSDKTIWQKMLKNEDPELDLLKEKEAVKDKIPSEYQQWLSSEDEVYRIKYPVLEYPAKVKSLNLDKNSGLQSVLKGVRGQYLIFEGGIVLNIRSHTGYRVAITV